MSRNDYDDMGPSFSRRGRGENKKTYIISFMGVLIILIAIILYIIFKPVDSTSISDESSTAEESNIEALDVPSVEEIAVRNSTPVSGIVASVPDSEVDSSEPSVISESFILPSDGEIILHFNDEYRGEPLEGIIFRQDAGSAVYAIADGFVSDVGNSIYGRFISIDHNNGFKSSYYCLELVNVKVGEKVEKGSVVATVGTSNHYFEEPTLYFILREGATVLDPEQYI